MEEGRDSLGGIAKGCSGGTCTKTHALGEWSDVLSCARFKQELAVFALLLSVLDCFLAIKWRAEGKQPDPWRRRW